MSPPLVIVTADAIVNDFLTWSACPRSYLDALALTGLCPALLPPFAERIDPEALLAAASGVLVTGARSNVEPRHYGMPADPQAEPHDPARDATSLPLIRAALDRGLPLLCICRGHQELNVVHGGTLVSEVSALPGRLDHRGERQADLDAWFRLKHEVEVQPGGLLERLLGAGPIKVNSAHRQAIDRLGEGLTVEALAPDGTVEAVSVTAAPAFALGVQWHPEHFVRSDQPSRAIFEAFAEAVRGRASAGGQNRARAA